MRLTRRFLGQERAGTGAMQPFEIIYVDGPVVACDGGGGAAGHPKVYLNLSAEGKIECPYCSRPYVAEAKRGQIDLTHPTAAETPPAAARKP